MKSAIPKGLSSKLDGKGKFLRNRRHQKAGVCASPVRELSHPRTPAAVRAWADKLSAWLEVRRVYKAIDVTLAGLGPGEQGAIQLARDFRADLLLMDERKGTKIARKRGLKVADTLGILLVAGRRGLVDIDLALTRLERTDFRSTPELFQRVRQLAHRGTSS